MTTDIYLQNGFLSTSEIKSTLLCRVDSSKLSVWGLQQLGEYSDDQVNDHNQTCFYTCTEILIHSTQFTFLQCSHVPDHLYLIRVLQSLLFVSILIQILRCSCAKIGTLCSLFYLTASCCKFWPVCRVNLLAPELFFLILAHSVYKM